MLRTTLLAASLTLLATTAGARPPWAGTGPVVAAERAFAARAGLVGVGPSFLEYMSDEAVVFSPDPLLARAVYGGRPAPKLPKDGGTLLNWWPNFAGISRSGDLGFTTGPATINGKPPGIFYFTVWTRQLDGGWKWVLDGGIDADGSAAPGPDAAPMALPFGDATPLAPEIAMNQVRAAEITLAARAKANTAAAYKAVLARGARVQGSAIAPATTPFAVDRELATRAKRITFGPIGGGASHAGDLAWTYGDARWEGGRGHYVRVWQRRASQWALVFDEIIPVEKAG